MDLSPDEEHFQGRLLHQAALWDNVELLQELLATGAEVDACDEHGRTALHAAALAERSSCLVALCAAKADLDRVGDESTGGKTALHIAAERGHVENVAALVAAGAGLGLRDARGDTALALAERAGHRHAAHALREARDALERERVSQHAQLRELLARGDVAQLKARLAALGAAAGLIVNLTPGGASTLLYGASEAGLSAAVSALLAAGADGRAHPVTKYCPLYIAAYHGHKDIARLLLAHFPEAARQETVEKWLPLHAACIGGHASMVTLLLEYPYPPSVLNTYTDPSGQWQYTAAFDANSRDASGQSALYVACTLGNLPVVEALLAHTRVPLAANAELAAAPPPRGISLGIHAIVSKLTGAKASTSSSGQEASPLIRPVCPGAGRPGDSCVAASARGAHLQVLRRLLAAGADPDAPALPPAPMAGSPRASRRRSRSAAPAPTRRARASPSPAADQSRVFHDDPDGPWTALAVAARAKNVQVVEALLAAGARDPGGRAAQECARLGLTELLAQLLATKAYPDPEYRLNKAALSALVLAARAPGPLSFGARCPATPVMLNWRDARCQLHTIRMSWVAAAALRVNSKLQSGAAALLAVTRLELGGNELRTLPPELFSMMSLRYLNAAQNKLERLPAETAEARVYTAPVLQELHLQDNRLEELPAGLLGLPQLSALDVSNNKLRQLPQRLWAAPALRDLNAALNLLRDLPVPQDECCRSPPQPSSPSEPPTHSPKPPSRSPSLSEPEPPDADGDVVVLAERTGHAQCTETRRAHVWRGAVEDTTPDPSRGGSALATLNLAHNQFTCVPPVLACRAPSLSRLNMAYNSLRSMSYVTSYPTSLRQLDLSHNEITCWPSLPQVESFGSGADPLQCFCPPPCPPRPPQAGRARPRSSGSVRAQLLSAACRARRHLRLEGLRTLILANNLLTRIQLTTDDDGEVAPADEAVDDADEEWSSGSTLKGRLLFPLLSMLDVSCNLLRALPPTIHALTNLSVLNLSGNKDITDLPPQMGLLSRLWNLNTVGCSLQEPLRSMLACGKYKSMDIVGYLKSVLQEARPYARMKLMIVGRQGIGKTSLLECLRQESAIQHRRKPTEHWAKRMGNKSSRRNMSTVGVDIGAWTYEKPRSTRGPVTFRTWDFGGQEEYYATHQYFLSRRSLYLCVWRATDGRRGLAKALDWLRSIQARAPGSPVIMVATHYDQVANCSLPESESPSALQRLIRAGVMGAPDADKLGLPRVLDSLEVSCATRHNMRLLADVIYSVAFSVKPAGSKEPLLEQRVPATYLALEECAAALALELPEPVLRHHDYKRLVTQYMQQKNLRMFRDAAELHQATMFLHENGVLLHYDDATLKQLVFLRPQWLCDVLAHVVTVREINPFANNGIMKVEDLAHVFKASPLLSRGEEATALAASLLNKFELALTWERVLLVPPLLPSAEPHQPQLPLRSRGWSRGPRRAWPRASSAPAPASAPACGAAPALTLPPSRADTPRGTDSPSLINEPGQAISLSGRGGQPLRRLLLLSYVPQGFWPRLCARVLADQALADAAPKLYRAPHEMESDEVVSKALDLTWSWKLWKTGLKLVCGELCLLALRELPPRDDPLLGVRDGERDDDRDLRFRVRQEGSWSELDAAASARVEILLPAQVCSVRRDDGLPIAGYQSVSLEPNPEILAKVLALVSDHVDLLLEDWYPALGTRFVHTSEGRCLITRLVPCPACFRDATSGASVAHEPHEHALAQALRLELALRPRLSQESRASDGDSGVGAESSASSRLGSVEGVVGAGCPPAPSVTAWTVEECILAACGGHALQCALHADVRLRDVAPDTLLLDVEESCRARWDQISRGAVAGRGAFGTVLAARWKGNPVALKALQPVPPPQPADHAQMHAYKAAVSRWEREPRAAACRAYCGLRQELGILAPLRHPHVVPLRAVCAAPLALLLELAPLGALDGVLRSYRDCGARVGARAMRALALQAARALEYLHARRIVYRDLKSENVLVWSMPKPQETIAAERGSGPVPVHVKLGDYGISRLAPPSGTKGFGGTEGFMAPEIMRYNGEEEYNEKVDCFSYGMLLYEIVTLRQPFEGHEAVKEAVLEGARPALSPRDLQAPCGVLETMRRCWAAAPARRPSAASLAALAAAPEAALLDAAAAPLGGAAAAANVRREDSDARWEVWSGGAEPERAHALLASEHGFSLHHTIRIPPGEQSDPLQITAACRVGRNMWLGDSEGRVCVYDIATCVLQWSALVQQAVGGAREPLRALRALPEARVAVATGAGRLFLVSSHCPEAEGSFVLTELGAATELCCLAVVNTAQGSELWAGGSGLSMYSVRAGGVAGAAQLAPDRVTLLAAHDTKPMLVAYYHPGTIVYQWCAETREQTARLDCSKLAPCSESLQSVIDEQRDGEGCTVTALCVVRESVFVGTARGCVLLADAKLRPLAVCRPHHEEVLSLVPLAGEEPRLVSIGRGYRPLLQRYAPKDQSDTTTTPTSNTSVYCLLWRAEHWLPD